MQHEQRTSAEQSGPRTSAGAWGLPAILAVIASLVFATAGLAQGRAGSDADISLEEGGTVPGTR